MAREKAELLHTMLNLMDRGDHEARVANLVRLGTAANVLLASIRDAAPSALCFADFKAMLRPDQAAKIAVKVEQLGQYVRTRSTRFTDDVYEPYLCEMAFCLLAASLHARGGATWIEREQEELIDRLIEDAVKTIAGLPNP